MNKKGINAFQLIFGLTVTVVALSAIIGGVLLHGVPSRSKSGSVLIVVSVAGILLLLLETFISRNQTMKYIAKMSTMISKTERDSLLNFPAPAAIIDADNIIVWYNKLFGKQVYTEEEVYGTCLTDIVNIKLLKNFIKLINDIVKLLAEHIKVFAVNGSYKRLDKRRVHLVLFLVRAVLNAVHFFKH